MDGRVLVAEDDPDDRVLVAEAFAAGGLGNVVDFVADGEELLERLGNRGLYEDATRFPRPDVVLLDLNMPRMDGREALRAIRADPALREQKVVVMTTSRNPEDRQAMHALGADGFHTKPSRFADLVALLRRVVSGSDGG